MEVSIVSESLFYFIRFSIFFFLYIVFIPAKVMGLKLSGKGAGENALKSMIASNITIISCVYLLGLLHIYNTINLVVSLLLVILVYLKLVKKVSYKQKIINAFRWMALISTGQYKLQVYLKNKIRKLNSAVGKSFKNHAKIVISKNFGEFLFVFTSLGILAARKWILVFDNYAYLTSDMYVHHEWINFMEKGDIFYDGVYPFGMHNIISAFHKLSFLNLNIVIRYWGAFNCILIPVMLWFIAGRIFRSRAAGIIPVIIYCVTDFAGYRYSYRAIYTLPQETGMLFLFPCFYYFGRFIKNRKWKDGLWFSMSAAIILSMHFFSVIFAVILCGCTLIMFIKQIMNKDMIKKMILSVGLIALISITPFVAGLVSGKSWQGSMQWAMGVMGSSGDKDTDSENNADDIDVNEIVNEEADSEEYDSKSNLKDKIADLYKLQVNDMNNYWGKIFWICMILFVIYYLICILLKKISWKEQMYGGIWLFNIVMIIMYSYEILGIPQIMKGERITMFIGYAAPLILAVPAEILCRIMKGRLKNAGIVGCYAAAIMLFYITYHFKYYPGQSYFYMEHSLAAEACVKIEKDFPDKTWTIVSPVEEYSLVGNNGYHYELWEFISSMEGYKEDMYIEIPTKYVFFILEKKPVIYNQYRVTNLDYKLEPLAIEDAKGIFTLQNLGISDEGVMKFYNVLENRCMMEAKLCCWIEEYTKAFPEQMEIYMEDEECIVYKFEQNPYMLNNFAINYGYNEVSEP